MHFSIDFGTRRLLAPRGLDPVVVAFETVRPELPESLKFLDQCSVAAQAREIAAADGQMTELLPNCFVAERTPRGWCYRLFGESLCERLRADLTGRHLGEVFVSFTADAIAHLFNAVTWRRAPVAVGGQWLSAAGVDTAFESVHAPLGGESGEAPCVLGCMSFPSRLALI